MLIAAANVFQFALDIVPPGVPASYGPLFMAQRH
jgi:hypothetical protein